MTSNVGPNGEPPKLAWWQSISLRQVAIGTLLVTLVVLAGAMLIALRYVLVLLFLAIVLGTALSPLVERLRARNVGRTASVALVFAVFLGVVAGVIALFVPFVLSQVERAITDLPAGYAAIRSSLLALPSGIAHNLASQLPNDPFAGLSGQQGVEVGARLARDTPHLLRSLALGVLVLLLSYYWLYYRTLSLQTLARVLPLDWRNEALELWNQIEAKVGAFIRGLSLLSLIIAVLSGVGFSLIGLPYAVALAVAAGLLEVIPYIGPLITLVLAATVGLTVSPELALKAAVVAGFVQFAESTFIVPRVMDKTVGVRPVVSLLALAIFSELFGLLGALLAVPLAAALQVLIDRFVLRAPAVEQASIGGRDSLALLRYQTQDLASDLRQQFRRKEDEIEPSSSEEAIESLMVDLDSLLAHEQEGRKQ